MKFILSLLIVSTSTFAIDPQEGGAGTVCLTKSGRWVATDELIRPFTQEDVQEYGESRKISFADIGHQSKKPSLNLTHSAVGQLSFTYLEKVWRFDKKLGNFLGSVAAFYSMDIPVSEKIINERRDLNTFIYASCDKTRIYRAIFTDGDGVITIYPKVWRGLSFKSASTLYIHELLRVANIRYNIMLSEEDIHELTYAFMNKPAVKLPRLPSYVRLKAFLSGLAD